MSSTLAKRDFVVFRPEYQKKREYNPVRLQVRRKLGDVGKRAATLLKQADVSASSRTSVHHPFSTNNHMVTAAWMYLSRTPAQRKELGRGLQLDLPEDTATAYTHALLVIQVGGDGLTTAFRIHPMAWWDGQNIKNKLNEQEHLEQFVDVLRNLDESFSLNLHDWKRTYTCAEIRADDVERVMSYYTPGEHWLHIRKTVEPASAIALGETWEAQCQQDLLALAPIYNAVLWNTNNNYLETA